MRTLQWVQEFCWNVWLVRCIKSFYFQFFMLFRFTLYLILFLKFRLTPMGFCLLSVRENNHCSIINFSFSYDIRNFTCFSKGDPLPVTILDLTHAKHLHWGRKLYLAFSFPISTFFIIFLHFAHQYFLTPWGTRRKEKRKVLFC